MNEATESLHFSDAFAVLAQQLASAQQRVVCALAGPCARPLFDLLLGCRRRGLSLTLVVSDAAEDLAPGLAWERMAALGATLHWLAAGAPRLHTSVCLVDGAIVLSGDLAGLGPAPKPQTAGVLLQANPPLATQCAQGLSALVVAHSRAQKTAPLTTPLTTPTPAKSTAPSPSPNTSDHCATSSGAEMTAFEDPLQWAPAWQTELLQAHALALQTDIAEMHRTINAFDQAQDAAIGPLLRDCLDAKRQHLHQLHTQTGSSETRAQAEEAQARFEQYTQAQDAKPAPPPLLEPEAQAQMKQLYRKLAMRLHPDRVDEDQKAAAQTLFQRLQVGYESNDLYALQALEQQVLTAPPAQAVAGPSIYPEQTGGKRSPAQMAADLKARMAQCQRERDGILRSATWQTLSTQSNWTVWFTQQASYLQAELQRYAQTLSRSTAHQDRESSSTGNAPTAPSPLDMARAQPAPAA